MISQLVLQRSSTHTVYTSIELYTNKSRVKSALVALADMTDIFMMYYAIDLFPLIKVY